MIKSVCFGNSILNNSYNKDAKAGKQIFIPTGRQEKFSSIPVGQHPFAPVCFGNFLNHQSNTLLDELARLLAKETGFDPQNPQQTVDELDSYFNKLRNLDKENKTAFLTAYSEKTGFPDMKKTSALIRTNAVEALREAENQTGIKALMAGYNPTCSVAIGKALPGSDLDTLFVCTEKSSDKSKFKSELKKHVDPLLCAMTWNRTDDLPDSVGLDEIMHSLELANGIFESKNLGANSSEYFDILRTPTNDWVQAGKFHLDMNSDVTDDEKTPLLRAGLVMEILRDGDVLLDDFTHEDREFMEDSPVYKYANMQQMNAYKNVEIKEKHKKRERLLADYNNLPVDEKLEMVIDVVKLSTKAFKNDKANRFWADNTCSNMEDMIQPLLSPKHRNKEWVQAQQNH